jgi:hypothetical protein
MKLCPDWAVQQQREMSGRGICRGSATTWAFSTEKAAAKKAFSRFVALGWY